MEPPKWESEILNWTFSSINFLLSVHGLCSWWNEGGVLGGGWGRVDGFIFFSKSIVECCIHFQPRSFECTLYPSHCTFRGRLWVILFVSTWLTTPLHFGFIRENWRLDTNWIGFPCLWFATMVFYNAFRYFSRCQFFGWHNGSSTSYSSKHQFCGTFFIHCIFC